MRRILFTAAAARARPVHRSPPLARTGRTRTPSRQTTCTSRPTITEPTLSSGLLHWACAGEHTGNTGQVVRDAEERPIPGPGTAQYQPGLYQNLGQQPNPNCGVARHSR